MLRALSIRDFVIVEALELDFAGGFTVFSGETGAGKSILVDALAVVLGGRADAQMVREGATRAEIAAECDVDADGAAWLSAQSLDAADTILLRRIVDTAGRSKAWINGSSVTLAQLRELGATLMDIYGQHAHQALLHSSAQRDLLDRQAGLEEQLIDLGQCMSAWRAATQRRERASQDAAALAKQRDLLAWQLEELDRLDPRPGEWLEVQSEHQRLAHAASLVEAAQDTIDQLSDADHALLPRLAPLMHRLTQLLAHDARLQPILDILEPARIQLQEAVYALTQYLDHLDLDPRRLSQIEARLDALHSSARKLRIAPEQLADQREHWQSELAALEAQSDLQTLLEEERRAEMAYQALAAKVRERRAACASALAKAVTEAMQTLSMEGGRFEIVLIPAAPSAHGTEQVEFLVAAHPGVEPRALAKVASGGELARISLAISVIASSAERTPTLIFDEVDAGIGGAVAEVVGRLLRRLGEQRQVLCVTHLPQVAACAQTHFAVSKRIQGQHTVSEVNALSASARVDEIARMLGGIQITATTKKHAKELLSGSERRAI